MSASSKKKMRKEQNAAKMTERQMKEQADAKKLKITTIAFVAVIVVIALVFGVMQIISGVNRSGVLERNSIALTVGEHELNAVTMNYYFFDAFDQEYQNIYSTYSTSTNAYYLAQGLDLTKPMNEQVMNKETGETWADHYYEQAIENARSDYAMYDLAMAADYKLSEDMQATIDTQLLYLGFYGSQYGSVDTYLKAKYGQGASEESYTEYLTTSVTAYAFYADHAESLEYDDEARRAYEKDRYNEFSAYSFNTYFLSYTSFLPEGVTESAASDEQKTAAREEASKVAAELAKATTLEEFDKAIGELEINKNATTPVKSTENKDVMHTTLYEEYAEWLSASDRKTGDIKDFPSESTVKDADGKETTVVNGHYLFMFIGRNDNLEPLGNVRHLLVKFTGGTTDANGNTTYTLAEKEKAKEKAQGYLDTYLAGTKDEASFEALVKEYSEDTSKSTGGLFEDIHPNSSYVVSFRDWATDPARVAGDTGLVESEYGYHVMYYVGDDELTYRDFMINNALTTEDMEKWHDEQVEKLTVTEGETKRVNLDLVYSAG